MAISTATYIIMCKVYMSQQQLVKLTEKDFFKLKYYQINS